MKKAYSEHLQKILSTLPTNPWVYQMKDGSEKVMYVGKAKNLQNRVRSYFDRTADLNMAKRQMVGKITDIELILCATEVEALVLETNLIKHLTPKYNILMKDDKNLAYIKITNSPIPELIKTRQRIRDGAEYFGPYVSAVEQSVRALRRVFKIRNCRVKFQKWWFNEWIQITDKAGKTIPCMDYYIGLCPAPCILEKEKINMHGQNLAQARQFLKWGSSEIIKSLEVNMLEKAKNLDFEDAQRIKEMIESLKWLSERQNVRDSIEWDVDVFLQYEKYDKTYVVLTQVRSNQIVWVFRHEVLLGIGDHDDLAVEFLMKQYAYQEEGIDSPDVLILRDPIADESFHEFLKMKKISIEYPKIWPKNDIIQFTLNQIREYAYKREMSTLEQWILTREHMVHVLERLHYPVPKKSEILFECYDISHTDGHFTYASRVVIVNGKPDPSRYKKYKIKSLEDGKIDDFASHREVMMRRTLEWLAEKNFPHLIIIDGGKGQLSSAVSGVKEGAWIFRHSERSEESMSQNPGSFVPQDDELRELWNPTWFDLAICSIAKRDEEIFLPDQKEPVIFQKGTPELMVLQKARDESHRFSITANKTARMKSMKKNILEEIPGIWPVTRKNLLKLAGNVDALKDISREELASICTASQIDALRDHGIIE